MIEKLDKCGFFWGGPNMSLKSDFLNFFWEFSKKTCWCRGAKNLILIELNFSLTFGTSKIYALKYALSLQNPL